MDTLKLHSHFENLLYVGRSVLTNTSSRIQRLFFKKEMCIYEYLFMEEVNKGIEIVVDKYPFGIALEIENKSKEKTLISQNPLRFLKILKKKFNKRKN